MYYAKRVGSKNYTCDKKKKLLPHFFQDFIKKVWASGETQRNKRESNSLILIDLSHILALFGTFGKEKNRAHNPKVAGSNP
ncbi:MAG: hypothetical protein ACK5L3_13055, partial [Oscillospiraceae bacterium]